MVFEMVYLLLQKGFEITRIIKGTQIARKHSKGLGAQNPTTRVKQKLGFPDRTGQDRTGDTGQEDRTEDRT